MHLENTAYKYDLHRIYEGHNKTRYINWKITKYDGILKYTKWDKHEQEPTVEAKGATIFRDFAIQTVGKIKSNRPYILV